MIINYPIKNMSAFNESNFANASEKAFSMLSEYQSKLSSCCEQWESLPNEVHNKIVDHVVKHSTLVMKIDKIKEAN